MKSIVFWVSISRGGGGGVTGNQARKFWHMDPESLILGIPRYPYLLPRGRRVGTFLEVAKMCNPNPQKRTLGLSYGSFLEWGDPNIDSKFYNPSYGDAAQQGTPNFGKPHMTLKRPCYGSLGLPKCHSLSPITLNPKSL